MPFGPLEIMLAVGVFVVVFLITNSIMQKMGLSSSGQVATQQTTQTRPAIQSTTDLNATAAELDKVDLGGLDKELNLLNSDASKF